MTDNEMLADALENAIVQVDETIKNHLRLRRRHLQKFEHLRKTLTILFDEKLLKMAIIGNSFVRNVSTYFVHKQNSKGELVLDALTRTEEIAKKAHEETGVPVIPEDFRHIGSSSAKLMKLMYQSDDYFSDRQSLVEEQVDTYLGFAEKVREQLPKGMRARNLQNTYSNPKHRDLHVLMHWLDNFAPSNTNLA